MNNNIVTFIIDDLAVGMRLDKWLTIGLPGKSRGYAQEILDEGMVFVNERAGKASMKLKVLDNVKVIIPPARELDLKAVDMDLDIVYEDINLIVINKPSGLVVHPGQGNTHQDDSLVNALLYHCKGKLSDINGVLRPGIVHRLDKDTSGLMVVAKNDTTHRYLADLFYSREVEKIYIALLVGHIVPYKGRVEAPIGRDTKDRKRMAVVSEKKGKMGISEYEVVDYLEDFSLVKIRLITGRTHQIRVHFSSIGFPLVGDDLYGKPKANKSIENDFALKRQFLHAGSLSFVLPGTKKSRTFKSALPNDLQNVIDGLSKRNS